MDEIRAELFDDQQTPDLEVFEPLPGGQHLLEVVDVKAGTAKTSGRGRFGFQVKIIGGEHADKKGWFNLNLPDPEKDPIDGFIRKTWKKLREVAPDAIVAEGGRDFTIKPDLFKGLQFRAQVTVTDYEGKPKNDFKSVVWVGYPDKTPEAPAVHGS